MSSTGPYETYFKRPLDVALAATAVVGSLPIHLLCVLAVRLTSGRPVYFRQLRSGRDGRTFELIKLRTMRVGTHELSGGYPASEMVTSVGRMLRKTSLDELPQLLNILRGDMSFVGPRPALPDQVARYTHGQRGRLVVRPGLTGLAQIRHRNQATWSVRIESDLEYVSSLSLITDLVILFRTIPSVLSGQGVAAGQTATEVDDLGEARPESGATPDGPGISSRGV